MSKISERIVNVQRHTVGFVVNREELTRKQTVKMVKQDRIKGVRVCHGPFGPYLASTTRRSLYRLPIRVMVGQLGATRRSR